MPDPLRLRRTIEQAVRAFRDTPGRRGRLVCLDGASEVFATGDLHGNIENFRAILEKADLAGKPRRHLVFQELIHGPVRYASGTDSSHQLVDLLAALKCQFPSRVHLLLGNHELAQWKNQSIAKSAEDLNVLFRSGVESAYGAHGPDIYAAYLELFAAVPLALRTRNRVLLSHSLPAARRLPDFDPAILQQEPVAEEAYRPGGPIHALLWGRDTRSSTRAEFLRKMDADYLISGHIPCPQGFEPVNESQVILDCSGTPAGYCLIPADRPLAWSELLGSVKTL
jgi:hypothetical protein